MENSEKVVLFFSDIFSKDIRKKLPSVDVLHKPISWRCEVRQACGILSMEVGAIALRESAENRGETQEKRSRKYDTSNYNLEARRALKDKDGKYLLHMTHFPIMCHGRHCSSVTTLLLLILFITSNASQSASGFNPQLFRVSNQDKPFCQLCLRFFIACSVNRGRKHSPKEY